jgi:hypothetical protein
VRHLEFKVTFYPQGSDEPFDHKLGDDEITVFDPVEES